MCRITGTATTPTTPSHLHRNTFTKRCVRYFGIEISPGARCFPFNSTEGFEFPGWG